MLKHVECFAGINPFLGIGEFGALTYVILYPFIVHYIKYYQRTNGPVNAHMISGPRISI